MSLIFPKPVIGEAAQSIRKWPMDRQDISKID
jgi:hypothetical protein